jgi:nitrite reductase (NAD(P)H)
MHKRNFSLTSGSCLNDDNYSIIAFDVKVDGDDISVLLPEEKDLDSVIATQHWMVKRGTAAALDGDARVKEGSAVEIVGPKEEAAGAGCGSACGDSKLDW